MCVCWWEGAGLPFFLWKERESEEKGRANDNRGCFGVDKDIHYWSQSKDSNAPAWLGRDKAGSGAWRRWEARVRSRALDLNLSSGSPKFQLCGLKQVT